MKDIVSTIFGKYKLFPKMKKICNCDSGNNWIPGKPGHFTYTGNVIRLSDMGLLWTALIMLGVQVFWGFPGAKEPAYKFRRHMFDPWVRKIPLSRAWRPTPVFLPGESHGPRSLVGYSPYGHRDSDTTEVTQHAAHICFLPQTPNLYLLTLLQCSSEVNERLSCGVFPDHSECTNC